MLGRLRGSTIASAIVIMASGLCAGSANGATVYQYDWDTSIGGSRNNSAGTFSSITATYNDFTRTMDWSVSFSDMVTEGLTLAVTGGPNPKSGGGDVALLYMDASNTSSPVMSAYSYNGVNGPTSWQSGPNLDPNGDPNPGNPAIFLGGSNAPGGASWLNSMSVTDTVDGRTMSFSIDAGFFQDYGSASDWTGIGFGEKIGIWMHTFGDGGGTDFTTGYNADGSLNAWGFGSHGWFDRSNQMTQIVPVPPAVWIAAAGLLGVAGVRRRYVD